MNTKQNLQNRNLNRLLKEAGIAGVLGRAAGSLPPVSGRLKALLAGVGIIGGGSLGMKALQSGKSSIEQNNNKQKQLDDIFEGL